jgi:hypothetical protein
VGTRRLVRALVGVAAALALLGAGCGGSDDATPSAESETTKAVAVDSAQAYRDRIADIVSGPDNARGKYHDVPPGELTTLVAASRELARASRSAAREIEELTPPASLNDLNGDLAVKYRRWAVALEREVRRRPVATARIGDVVREYGKAADEVYEQILIAP